jgi:hypothetical protein
MSAPNVPLRGELLLDALKQDKFISVVERLSGRSVLAFISNQHVGPDMEVELFMLQPRDQDGDI